jgi:hypothetical protein
MVSATFTFFSLIYVAVVHPVAATAAATEVFPSLRKKRMEKEREMEAKPQAEVTQTQVVAPAKKDDAPVIVPPPADVGTSGFPELPAVSTMLGAASGTLKSVNSKASTLEARVVQAQMQSESKMARQKAAFEEKLKAQEEDNRLVIAANGNISAEISQLQASNEDLRKRAHEVEESNTVMRSEFHTLETHLGVAKDFTAHSLQTTDDSKNALLEVLKVGGSRHHRKTAFVDTSDDDDTDDDSDSDNSDDEDDSDGAASFLSMSMRTHRTSADFEADLSQPTQLESTVPSMSVPDSSASSSDANDLLEVLSKEVANLAQQEKESQTKLKDLFIRDFRAGAKRHQALLAQQKVLISKRGSLQAVKEKLEGAVAHLEGTKMELGSRLKELGQFLQKLTHFALAPQKEVSHLMKVLPKEILHNKVDKSL